MTPKPESSAARVHRCNVNFSDQAWGVLNDLAARKGKTLSDVLRDALATEKWLTDLHDSGEKLIVEKRDGTLKELVFRGL